jgi:hypothetical protein
LNLLACWTLSNISYLLLLYLVAVWERKKERKQLVKGHFPTSHEPWPWNCESPKEKCPKAVPTHLQHHVVHSPYLLVRATSERRVPALVATGGSH